HRRAADRDVPAVPAPDGSRAAQSALTRPRDRATAVPARLPPTPRYRVSRGRRSPRWSPYLLPKARPAKPEGLARSAIQGAPVINAGLARVRRAMGVTQHSEAVIRSDH